MNHLYLGATVALLFAVSPKAVSQDNPIVEPKPMHLERLTPQGNLVHFFAATIVPRTTTVKIRRTLFGPYGDQGQSLGAPGTIIHLEGDVKITIFNRALMLHASTRDELTEDMVLTADQADYNVDTGEIQPEGHVSIKFPNAESRPK